MCKKNVSILMRLYINYNEMKMKSRSCRYDMNRVRHLHEYTKYKKVSVCWCFNVLSSYDDNYIH